MAADFYTEMASTATQLISEFGLPVKVTHADGSTTKTKGVLEDKIHRERGEGGQVTVTGTVKHLYLPALKKVPKPLDTVYLNATNHVITAVSETKPGGTSIMYDCELQG